MRYLQKVSFLAFILLFIIPSCGIEKRLHMTGYHIALRSGKYSSEKQISNEVTKNKEAQENQSNAASSSENSTLSLATIDNTPFIPIDNSIIASTDNSEIPLFIVKSTSEKVSNHTEIVVKNQDPEKECDIIILKNSDEIPAKVLEVGTDYIKYKECANLDGPIFTKNKSELFMIKYVNGTKTVFSQDNNNSSTKNSSDKDSSKGGKSQLIALLLCIFLGGIGIHRFYLGYTGMGILYLLTGGLCGIGVIVDFIRIITGNLKPKRGEYKDEL